MFELEININCRYLWNVFLLVKAIYVTFLTKLQIRLHIKINKEEDKDQESIQSSTTPDPGYQWESDNVTMRHHKREPRGQPFPSKPCSPAFKCVIKISIVMINFHFHILKLLYRVTGHRGSKINI